MWFVKKNPKGFGETFIEPAQPGTIVLDYEQGVKDGYATAVQNVWMAICEEQDGPWMRFATLEQIIKNEEQNIGL